MTIRPIKATDVAAVAELADVYFPTNIPTDPMTQANRFVSPSLVCQAKDGSIQGYIGIKYVPYVLKGESITIAICSDFMATDEARAALMPMRMLQVMLKGPQDASYTEDANITTKLLWMRMGGMIAYPYSVYYTTPLRPLTLVLRVAGSNALEVVALGLDRILQLLHVPYFHTKGQKGLRAVPLTGAVLAEGIAALMPGFDLVPDLNEHALADTIEAFRVESQFGRLQSVALLDSENHCVAWFMYYMTKKRRCEMIQAESLPGYERPLIEAFRHHAQVNGGVVGSGRLSPNQIGTPFAEQVMCRPGRNWAMVHSKRADVLQSVLAGKAFMSKSWA